MKVHACVPPSPEEDDISLRTCKDCGEVFGTRKQRKKHKNRGQCSVEREVRSCFCTVCNVMVPPDDVGAHREIEGHEERAKEKGFWCQLCERTYINEAGLADHMVTNAGHLENVKMMEKDGNIMRIVLDAWYPTKPPIPVHENSTNAPSIPQRSSFS
jgi:hypothetical protein